MTYTELKSAVKFAERCDPDQVRVSLSRTPGRHKCNKKSRCLVVYIGANVLEEFGLKRNTRLRVMWGEGSDRGFVKLVRPGGAGDFIFKNITKRGVGRLWITGLPPEADFNRNLMREKVFHEVALNRNDSTTLLFKLPKDSISLTTAAGRDARAMESALKMHGE